MPQDSAAPAEVSREGDFEGRFWYWHGASGTRYIHSVYRADCCPPLPGAVYVAVRRQGELREAVAVGRFSRLWDAAAGITGGLELEKAGVDELHVHLLARGDVAMDAVAEDLCRAMGDNPTPVMAAA